MTRRSLISLLGAARSAFAGTPEEFAVIVNKSNRYESITRARLAWLFQRRISRWPWGAEVVPIEVSDRHLNTCFARAILRSTLEAQAVYWIDQKATRNINAPLRLPSVEAVITEVASRPGAIAYIPPPAVDSRVRPLRLE